MEPSTLFHISDSLLEFPIDLPKERVLAKLFTSNTAENVCLELKKRLAKHLRARNKTGGKTCRTLHVANAASNRHRMRLVFFLMRIPAKDHGGWAEPEKAILSSPGLSV